MTFQEAKQMQLEHPEKFHNGMTMFAHIVPGLQKDFISYSSERATSDYDDELAKEFSSNGEFTIYWLDVKR